MLNLFGKLFERKDSIEVDLGQLNLEKIFNLPNARQAGLGEFYVNRVIHENHLEATLAVKKGQTIHTMEYDPNRKIIELQSRFVSLGLELFRFAIVLIFPIFAGVIGNLLDPILIALGAFIFLTGMLAASMHSNAGEVKRELIIRINYMRNNRIG